MQRFVIYRVLSQSERISDDHKIKRMILGKNF